MTLFRAVKSTKGTKAWMLIGLRLLGEATLRSVASRTDGPGPVVGGS
ncbi:hypothetical protein [Glutamicibacter nicotianae]|nr:hypothetical protein [Glutamicibacter nicotianae]MBM7767729.1 hypothetical protein [Glutamicibacter nicotianae]